MTLGRSTGRVRLLTTLALAGLFALLGIVVLGDGGAGDAAAQQADNLNPPPAALEAQANAPTAAELARAAAGKGASRKVPVIFVGNNWDGTAHVIATRNGPRGKYRKVARISIVPDFEERMAEVIDETTNPLNPDYDPTRLGFFIGIQQAVGEGNNQLVDDMYSTPDGKLLVVSRPSFRDVIGLRIAGPKTGQIKWRFEVAGQRSDHMAVSPDGKRVAISASTGNVVHLLDTKTGEETGSFPSGDSPHENTYSANGKRIYHASIGLVYTPGDGAVFDTDTNKGDRFFQVVRARDGKILSRVDMGTELSEAGFDGFSSAVRPMAISSNEKRAYLQVSFFHGIVSYDLKRQRVTRVANLPNLVPELPRETYLLDSAHHGIALSGDDRKLCVAGTMSDYATIFRVRRLRRGTLTPRLLKHGTKPYWSTTSANGKRCYVSWSGTDDISVYSYRKRKEVRHFKVGDHPQRIRNGFVRRSFIRAHR